MLIKNLRELNAGYGSLESAFINAALMAYEEAVKTCDPYEAILRNLKLDGNSLLFNNKNYDLDSLNNIFVIGAGKAGLRMAKAIYDLLGNRITEGCIAIPQNSGTEIDMLGNIRIIEAAHPVPDMDSVLSARIISRIATKAGKNDLVIFLLSGGASSLMCLPVDGISLADKQKVNNLLLKSGADISEINTVRKSLSAVKGGKLAEMAYPAEVILLVVSDVLGNSLENIGSGPFSFNNTTIHDCIKILKKYSLWDSLPESVENFFSSGNNFANKNSYLNETRDKYFYLVNSSIIADNKLALSNLSKYLEDYDFKIYNYPNYLTGEASIISKDFYSFVSEIKKDNLDSFAVIAGGEPVITFKKNNFNVEWNSNSNSLPYDGIIQRNELNNIYRKDSISELSEFLIQKQKKINGTGGRYQELALSMLKYFPDSPKRQMFFLAAGTDGIDGPTDSAGAIITEKTFLYAKKMNYNFEDYLERHDSYNFFKRVGGLIKTGYTGTNVNDVFIALVPSKID